MKQDILEVLEQFKYGNYSIDQAANELLEFSVSQQRELLIGLLTRLEKDGGNEWIDKEYIVNKYLANL